MEEGLLIYSCSLKGLGELTELLPQRLGLDPLTPLEEGGSLWINAKHSLDCDSSSKSLGGPEMLLWQNFPILILGCTTHTGRPQLT